MVEYILLGIPSINYGRLSRLVEILNMLEEKKDLKGIMITEFIEDSNELDSYPFYNDTKIKDELEEMNLNTPYIIVKAEINNKPKNKDFIIRTAHGLYHSYKARHRIYEI